MFEEPPAGVRPSLKALEVQHYLVDGGKDGHGVIEGCLEVEAGEGEVEGEDEHGGVGQLVRAILGG